ncbi:MAG: pyridoxal-phosphate dependent enzyme, partial [Acidobacteriia bacterium]|nr:pyridoxal-phosphate dependent enzyme [Terriglobia bacterium]
MITVQEVERAQERIREAIFVSPCVKSHALSEMTGNAIYLKLENLQMTGSFKERGALNRLLGMSAEERTHGVIAASAGNHAQGVAYHATRLGVRSLIVMPLHTPLVK